MELNLLDISLLLQGYPITAARKELLRIQNNFTLDAVAYQEKMKWEIYHHHLAQNKVYKNFVQDHKIYDWQDVPVLGKKDIQMPLNERLTEGFYGNKIHVHNTSGSSGTPFYFAKDKFCHAMTWSNNIRHFGWFGINFNSSLQARFYGIPLDFIGNKKRAY